jgi:hypothetical protein
VKAACYFQTITGNGRTMATALLIEKSSPQSDASAFDGRIDVFLRAKRKWIVACCCCYAALRVLIFAAAFPLFNPVDEQHHYEMIYRYSQGYAPEATLPRADPNVSRVSTLYGSPEYFNSHERLRSFQRDVPIAALPPGLKEYHYRKVLEFWMEKSNMEAQSPPVYYAVAGVWTKLGVTLGAKEWVLAYWTRFLNPIIYAIFIWISFLFVRELYPERDFLCVAVPMLLAVFPQDVFFGMNRDVLSPLFGALAMLVLFRAMRGESDSHSNLIGGGFLVGLASLTDVSNFVLFGLFAVAVYNRSRTAIQLADRKEEIKVIAASVAGAMLFPILWMAHNVVVMGDLTGSRLKTDYLGWTLRTWSEIRQHPIFSVNGFHYFINVLIETFWRGEIAWQGGPMRGHFQDGFYRISSLLLVAVFAAKLLSKGNVAGKLQRLSGLVSLYLVLASVLFMAVISLPFDFHECVYPSREHPYFVSGRIIIGVLLPFALIYLSGLEYLLRPVRRYFHPMIPFTALVIFLTVSEFVIRRDIFHSAFNLFSLVRM